MVQINRLAEEFGFRPLNPDNNLELTMVYVGNDGPEYTEWFVNGLRHYETQVLEVKTQ